MCLGKKDLLLPKCQFWTNLARLNLSRGPLDAWASYNTDNSILGPLADCRYFFFFKRQEKGLNIENFAKIPIWYPSKPG